ncbi:MAG: acyl-phosphate glycerol 3-phosphate acyltransferase [Planctomycetes bacterium]|nr:acyl-phosphate glycerol 3-phosphate acyltransferase [Planctomycetota bacterium]
MAANSSPPASGSGWAGDSAMILCWALGGYLLGAVPFGLVLARTIKGVDLRSLGSGNIGATNAMRALGRPLGVLAFLLDFLKGYLPVFLVAQLALGVEAGGQPILELAAGTAAVLGHCFPVYLRFKGGKGVSTACGALVAIDPLIFLLGGGVWLLVLALTRFVGLASIAMGLAFPFLTHWRTGGEPVEYWIGSVLIALLILWRHRSNMSRMIAGQEPRIASLGERRRPTETEAD